MPRATTRVVPAHTADDDNPAPGSPEWRLQVGADGGVIDDEPEEETAQDRVFALLRDTRSAQNAKVKLYRVNPGTKNLGWCQDYTPDEFENGGFENIRAIWGAGTFEIRMYGQNASGKHVCLARSPVEIIAPMAAPVASAPSGLEKFLEAQQQFNQQLLAAVTQKKDPVEELRATFGLMTMMREAMGMTGNQAPQKSSIAEIMEAVREMRSVADELVPAKESEADANDPMAIVGKIADLIGKAMQNPQSAALVQQHFPAVQMPQQIAHASAPAAPAAPAEAAAPPADGAADETPLSEEEQVALLRTKFAEVLEIAAEWASLKKPSRAATACVEAAADIVDELLPDEESLEMLRGDAWLTMLTAVVPDAAAHGAFLTEVRASLLAEE